MSKPGCPRRVAFIVGAGRSGTTLMYKALCSHGDVGWISNYMARLGGLPVWAALNRVSGSSAALRQRAWYGEQGNAFLVGRRSMYKLVPTPVEGEAVYKRCGVPLFPAPHWEISEGQIGCLRHIFDRLMRWQGASVLLSKRTANNRRIPQLAAAFPEARFLHIIRDGRAVAESLLRVPWWSNHQLWWSNGQTPQQLEREGQDPRELAARNWVEEVRTIQEGLKAVEPAKLYVLKYEAFLADPVGTARRLAEFIGLSSEPHWLNEIGALRVADARYTPRSMEPAFDIQRELLQELGYAGT